MYHVQNSRKDLTHCMLACSMHCVTKPMHALFTRGEFVVGKNCNDGGGCGLNQKVFLPTVQCSANTFGIYVNILTVCLMAKVC